MTKKFAIVDFDGTLINLRVDWGHLRRSLGVKSISELWNISGESQWDTVTTAEIEAVETSEINTQLIKSLQNFSQVAILSNNSNYSIKNALLRIESDSKDWLIFGRESIEGPKEDWGLFNRVVRKITEQWMCSLNEVVYFGDSKYEIDYAQVLGLKVVPVKIPS